MERLFESVSKSNRYRAIINETPIIFNANVNRVSINFERNFERKIESIQSSFLSSFERRNQDHSPSQRIPICKTNRGEVEEGGKERWKSIRSQFAVSLSGGGWSAGALKVRK